MKPKILVTRKMTDEAEKKLAENFDATFNKEDEPIPYEELINLANQYDGLVVSGWDKFDENFFNQMNGRLKIIATFSVGYDHINIKSAEQKKIIITNTPNVLNDAVAELTIFLMLAACRKVYEGFNLVKSGKWKDTKVDFVNFVMGQSMTGKTLGIIELGGDLDVFRFDLKTPMTILVKSSGNTDLFAEILDNAGRLLSSDDNSKDSNNFMMKLPLLPGPHFIRAKHYSSEGTGDYMLTLESSEMYDKQADDLILNKTKAYFHLGHIIYKAHFNNDKSYYVERIQIDSVLFNLDSKRFITITVNDSIQINPSLCYVASYGKYENLGIIQKNYISNPLNTRGLPRYLPEEILTNSLIFGVVRDYNTREPIFGAEVRLYGMPPSNETSQTSIIELSKGQTWVDGGTRMPTKKPLFNAPKINGYRDEKGRRITGVNGKYAIAVRDTGFLVIKANAPTNNYRYQEKKIRIRNKKGDFYSTDIWLIPK